ADEAHRRLGQQREGGVGHAEAKRALIGERAVEEMSSVDRWRSVAGWWAPRAAAGAPGSGRTDGRRSLHIDLDDAFCAAGAGCGPYSAMGLGHVPSAAVSGPLVWTGGR
ncbi:hypothetical protein, partial [Actinoplanes philippinensis]|uniref:hypothetical protein n=1 Tax=Actinoplanes philippinensis TaxID=35752 RepID=UPI003F4D6E69